MKLQLIALNPELSDEPPEINRSNCCICSTDAGIESLAKQFAACWKHGILSFDPSRLSNSHIIGDDRASYPKFENAMKANTENSTIIVRTISLITNSRKK